MKKIDLDEEYIIREYKTGRSSYNIGEELNCSATTIRERLYKNNCELRTSRKYFFNENFFENIDTPEKAWFLGWIYSDGHLKKDGYRMTIKLQEEDSYILSFFSGILKSTPPLYIEDDNGYKRISFNSKKMSRDLNNIGIPYGNKSRIIKPPKISNFLLSAFWQGVWEGDGTVHIGKHYNQITFGLTGNNYTCNAFKNYMNWNTKIVKSNTTFAIRKTSNEIEIVRNIISKLYNNSLLKKGFFLKRKYDKIKNWEDSYEKTQS